MIRLLEAERRVDALLERHGLAVQEETRANLALDVFVHGEGEQSLLARAIGGDFKDKLSIALALVRPWLAQRLYLAVALLWLVPDRRIERLLCDED